MEKEFNLSEKRQDRKQPKPIYNTRYTYDEEDIKEFIKRDTELIELALNGDITWDKLWKKRDKLAGDKLC